MRIDLPKSNGNQTPPSKLSSKIMDMKFMRRGNAAAGLESHDAASSGPNSPKTPEPAWKSTTGPDPGSWSLPGVKTSYSPKFTTATTVGYTDLESSGKIGGRRLWKNGKCIDIEEEEEEKEEAESKEDAKKRKREEKPKKKVKKQRESL